MMPTKNIELLTRWVVALRSGEYKQLHGELTITSKNHGARHCCLGVLQAIEPSIEADGGLLNANHLTNHMGCGIDQYELAEMNDEQDKTFTEIADYIERVYINNEEGK